MQSQMEVYICPSSFFYTWPLDHEQVSGILATAPELFPEKAAEELVLKKEDSIVALILQELPMFIQL